MSRRNFWDERSRKNNKKESNVKKLKSEYTCAQKGCADKAVLGSRYCDKHLAENNDNGTNDKEESYTLARIDFKIDSKTGHMNIGFEHAEAIDSENLLNLIMLAENKVRTAIFANRFNEKSNTLNGQPDVSKDIPTTEGGYEE